MGFFQSLCNYTHDNYTLFCILQFRQCGLWKNNRHRIHIDPVFSTNIYVCNGHWNGIYTSWFTKRIHCSWNQAADVGSDCKYNVFSFKLYCRRTSGVFIIIIIANDILQFAGLSFILVGIFKWYNVRTIKIFIVSIGFSLIASYSPDLTFSNIYLNQLLGHFIGTYGMNNVSCFPILNWFIIPVCGMFFGENLITCNDKDELYTKIIKPTSTLTFIMLIVGLITMNGMFSVTGGTVPEKLNYLHASLPDIVILIIVSLFIGSLFYFVAKKSSPAVIDFIRRTINNVTVIYIIQWGTDSFLNIHQSIFTC